MEISKCIRCGSFYSRIKSMVCPKCEIEEEKDIFRVQQHLGNHPGQTLEEVSDALNIFLEDIDRWIEEKRLSVEVKGISDRQEAVRKLYNTVREGIEEETAAAKARLKATLGGEESFGLGGGKYRRV